MPPHVRRGGTRGRSNTPRHATQACAGLSAGRSAPRTQGKFAAFDEFCKRLKLKDIILHHRRSADRRAGVIFTRSKLIREGMSGRRPVVKGLVEALRTLRV